MVYCDDVVNFLLVFFVDLIQYLRNVRWLIGYANQICKFEVKWSVWCPPVKLFLLHTGVKRGRRCCGPLRRCLHIGPTAVGRRQC